MSIKMTVLINWLAWIALAVTLIVFVGCIIADILAYFIRRIKRRVINIVALASFFAFLLLAMGIPSSLRTPGAEMGSEYFNAVLSISRGNYRGGLGILNQSKKWAKYVPDDAESEILKAKPRYFGEIDYLISCLDGGSLSASDLQSCIDSGDMSAVGYMWTKGAQHIILNVYPSGVAYLAIETGDYGKTADILGEQFEGSNYSREIEAQKPFEGKPASCWRYESDDCISNIAKAVALDQSFMYDEAHRALPKMGSWTNSLLAPSTDYFAISCRGNQLNGYCDIAEGNPPWGNFRQVVLDIVKATLDTGTEITPEEYMKTLQETEGNSGVQILTGSDFSREVVLPD